MMKVSMIAAVAENGVIGKDNRLPFRLRDDMRFFVETTRGHTVITGRMNFDAMGRPLPKRRNIVVTRNSALVIDGAETVPTIEDALDLAERGGETEAFVIGGAQIYALAYPYAHCFYRTLVLAEIPGDVIFPDIDLSDFDRQELFRGTKNEDNEHDFLIEKWVRRSEPLSFRTQAPREKS